MRLTLDAEGFDFTFPGRLGRQRWNEVGDFTATTANRIPFVTYDDGKRTAWWQLNRVLYFNRKAWLPDTYGLRAQDLARLMTAWRALALARLEGVSAAYGSSSVSQ
jgi:hypothetical protein